MKLNIERIDGHQAAVVSFSEPSLVVGNAKSFKEQMQGVLDANRTVMLDMSGVEFVDSSGLGALLSNLRAMNNKDGQLKLFAMTKPVQALFELVRMHRIFAIYPTRDDAMASL